MAWTIEIWQEPTCLLKRRAVPKTIFLEENLCPC